MLHTYAFGHYFYMVFFTLYLSCGVLPILGLSRHNAGEFLYAASAHKKVVFALRSFFWKNMEQENVKKTRLFAAVGILTPQSAETVVMSSCCSSLSLSSLCVEGRAGLKDQNNTF